MRREWQKRDAQSSTCLGIGVSVGKITLPRRPSNGGMGCWQPCGGAGRMIGDAYVSVAMDGGPALWPL